jgi:hypothetical protein
MKNIARLLLRGENYFGSGSYNSEEFDEFFKSFKKSFTRELKKINAVSIEFSKGHFYLSGFFKVNEQHYYFSISDVRHGFGFYANGKPRMLIRTAEHNKDYTGGGNNYVEIDSSIHKKIAVCFNLDIKETPAKKVIPTIDFVAEIINKGSFDGRIPSTKQAVNIGFELLRQLELTRMLTETKRGRTYVCVKFDNDKASFYYDASSKRLTIEIK